MWARARHGAATVADRSPQRLILHRPVMLKRLVEIAALFFKLGTIGFGGPAVHIASMEDEVVQRRKWLTSEHFLDLVGATNLIPGPNATEVAIHVGFVRGGWLGLVVAGACFILPAAIRRIMRGMFMCGGHALWQGASQSPRWSLSSSSSAAFLCRRTASLLVSMAMPSDTSLEHEGSISPLHSRELVALLRMLFFGKAIQE